MNFLIMNIREWVEKNEKTRAREFLECWCNNLAISNVYRSAILRIFKIRNFDVIGARQSELMIIRMALFWRICNLERYISNVLPHIGSP